MTRAGWRFTLRALFTAALLGTIVWRIDLTALASQFQDLDYKRLAAALVLTVPQVVISAWRWRLTARCVGLRLTLGAAIREYYLATFLNQVLPGGVLGDAHRAWRHARRDTDTAAAWHAVFIERFSGQLSLALVTVVALWQAPALTAGVAQRLPMAGFSAIQAFVVLVAILLLIGSAGAVAYRYPQTRVSAIRFLGNTHRSLLARSVWPAQFASSLLVVASYIGVFLLCAQAIALATPLDELIWLIPPVLMAMAVPLSIAGWGLREGAAAVVWTLVGLPAHEGVALSLCYGALVLVSSSPGAVLLWWREPALQG
ncbi:hypothetical protein T35B1_12457 [Salinisphaera shabanensis T35B1]|uniref:lysylphosphatidylglycerol synthase transmembrane domain-containing protein n=1 Tax=Salinisphaera shabanensis TaxID=180542 RepID=UPI00333E81A7